MWQIIKQISPYAIAFAIPLLITTLGALYSSKGGILNIALEGIMIIGSFISGYCSYELTSIYGYVNAAWIGICFSIIGGALFSLLHAFASINLNANQTISSMAINIAAPALVWYVSRALTGSGMLIFSGLPRRDVPILNNIPLLGPILFKNSFNSTWLVLFIVLISYFIINKTVFGLQLRSCGEHPEAAESAGINVKRIRYLGVLISGALAGMGGAIYTLTIAGMSNGSVAGLGFLALSSLIFGQYNVIGICAANLFFGYAMTLGQVSQVISGFSNINPMFFKIFPYVMTLIAFILFSKKSTAPRALGRYFEYKK